MPHNPDSPTSPLFDTETVAVTHLSDSPDGFEFEAHGIGRTEDLAGPVGYKEDELQQLQKGMEREATFSGAKNLRAMRDAYLHPYQPLTPVEQTKLREQYLASRGSYLERGKKLGLTAITQTGNTLTAEAKIVSFPIYRDFATHEASDDLRTLSRAAGVAMILRTADHRLIVQHRAVETVKLHEPGKTPGNAIYSDMPGASVAGMMDASLKGKGRRPGTPDAVTTDSVRSMILKETGEELGLEASDLGQIKLVGVASDRVKPHDELLLVADSKLTAAKVYEASKHSTRNKDLNEIDLDEKFFDIEASPDAVATLLCEVKCPLPPTHAAALIAAGYLMMIERGDIHVANTWRTELERRFATNYAAIDDTVRDFYNAFPKAALQVPERYWNGTVPPRNPLAYDPRYTPEEQGLPSIEDEMVRTGLLPETRRIVDTAYLFDVDGVLTDPEEKKVSPEILTELRTRLEQGQPVGLNTGRSAEWVVTNVITPLLARVDDKNILQNAIVIGEKGTTWALFNEHGDARFGKVDSLTVPDKLRASIERLIAEYADSMSNLDPKTTMFSIEMNDGYNLSDFKRRRAEFAPRLRKLVEDSEYAERFRIDETTIATDVENPHVGKALGAIRFADFLRLRGVRPQKYVAFGDSVSDLSMADELVQRKQDVTMVFVGDEAKLPTKNTKYPLVTRSGHREATAGYLRENR